MILRVHHLLCTLGFRGLGYSENFVENMSRLVDQLHSSPAALIEITDKPDDICLPCPFLGASGCQQKGSESEERVRNRDRAVIEKLGLTVGLRLSWAEIARKIGTLVNTGDLDKLCQECDWLPYGYCTEGLKNLKSRFRD